MKTRFIALKTALFSLIYGVCISWILTSVSYISAIAFSHGSYPRLAIFLFITALFSVVAMVITLIFNARSLLARDKVALIIVLEILGALLVFILTLDPVGALIKWLQVIF